MVQNRDLDAKDSTDIRVAIVCCCHRSKSPYKGRAFILFKDNRHHIGCIDHGIDNHELLVWILPGYCLDRIGEQKSDRNNEVKRTRSGGVPNVGKVISSAGTLDFHHLQTEVRSRLLRALVAHVIKGEIPPSTDVGDQGHLAFECCLGHSRCHHQSDHQHRYRKDSYQQLCIVLHLCCPSFPELGLQVRQN